MDEAVAAPNAFTAVSVATLVVTTITMVGLALARTGGHLAYVIDDGGIHLSIARNFGLHFTWGVVPHHFQSASSSPLWTVLLAIVARVTPRTMFEYAPLVLSTAAATWLLVLLGREQTIFRRRFSAVLGAIVAVPMVIVLLFLPTLAMTGMEHVLHCMLVVQAVALCTRAARAGVQPARTAYIVLALAAATRYETLFVAAGLGVALLLTRRWRHQIGPVLLTAAAAATPIVLMGLISIGFGQQFFPNSILAKSALGSHSNLRSVSILHGIRQLDADHAVFALFLLAVAYLVAAGFGRVRRSLVPAIVLVVATALHSLFADYHWFERYEAYLIAIGLFFLLGAVGEIARQRTWYVAAGSALLLAMTIAPAHTKWDLVFETPLASKDTYLQRYQAGKFLAHYYDNQPIATSELGYISYFHTGPITDVLGLGDHEVLAAREAGRADASYFGGLMQRRGVHVVVVYWLSLFSTTPQTWTLVGQWVLDVKNISAFDSRIQFWAPNKSDVEPILRELETWNKKLPKGAHTEVNPFLPYKSALPKFACC